MGEYVDMMHKRRSTELQSASGGGTRRWDTMPSDILVQIFLQVPLYFLLHNISCVCRSWRTSVFEKVFPSTEVLELNKLDNLPVHLLRTYLRFLQILLDTRPPTQWRILISPVHVSLKERALCYIAERSPCMQNIFVSYRGRRFESYQKALPYWKNLKEIQCLAYSSEVIFSLVRELATHCKNLYRLGLIGRIGTAEASAVVENLPGLEYLFLGKSSLTMDALSIFDGHKKIVTLNLNHSLVVEERVLERFNHGGFQVRLFYGKGTRAKEWKELRQKVSGSKRYLHCEQDKCPECSWAYEP